MLLKSSFFLVSCCSGIRLLVVSNSWSNERVGYLNTRARGKVVVHAFKASLVSFLQRVGILPTLLRFAQVRY